METRVEFEAVCDEYINMIARLQLKVEILKKTLLDLGYTEQDIENLLTGGFR